MEILEVLITCFVGVVLVFVTGFLVFIIFSSATEDTQIIELRSNDWECVEHVKVQKRYYMLVGKVTVPQTKTYNECVNYKKISDGSSK